MQRGTGWLVFLPTWSGRAVFQNSKPTGPVGFGVHVRTGRPVLGSTLSLGEAIFLFFAQANSQKCRFRYGSKNGPKTERPALFRLFAPKNVVICMSKQSEMIHHFFHEKSQNAAWSSAFTLACLQIDTSAPEAPWLSNTLLLFEPSSVDKVRKPNYTPVFRLL